jgi:Beta-galactosidase
MYTGCSQTKDGIDAAITSAETEGAEKALTKPDEIKYPQYKKVSAESVKYKVADDGGLIYDALSKEAELNGTLHKYDSAAKTSVTANGDGFSVSLELPTEFTAYDMVPINYTITKTSERAVTLPVTLEATAYEEAGRYADTCFDLTVPGSIDMAYEYEGSVTGTIIAGSRNIMENDNSDTPADYYPNYKTTDLNTSGTVSAGDFVWLKFKYTNTGNTILDCEGAGNFNIYPELYKKAANGDYQFVGGIWNDYVRETSYVYPGESREFWVNFIAESNSSEYGKTPQNQGLTAGDYKIVFTTLCRFETDYNPDVNLYHGRPMQVSEYEFTVSDTAADTKPNKVIGTQWQGKNAANRAIWLHYFEEFMTSFVQYRKGLAEDKITGTLYLQCAPWTNQIVLKIISGNPEKLSSLKIPVKVETDSIKLVYDEDNINVIVNDEGYEEPVICIQTMPDLRANIQISPYPEETIVKDLLTAQECGANVMSWQGFPWIYDSVTAQVSSGKGGAASNMEGDSLKYALDICRVLGLKSLGLGSYPFGRMAFAGAAEWITGNKYTLTAGSNWDEADYGDKNVAAVNAISSLYERSRWGDLYWDDATGTNLYAIEDTRGLMRYEHQCRYGVGIETKKLFREWLKQKYGTIKALNSAWSSDYKTFIGIDPEANQPFDDTDFGRWVYFTNKATPFYEWSPALIDYDIFRTFLRVQNYEDFISYVRRSDENAAVQMRTEGSVFAVPGLDMSTTNIHYRQIIYSQLKGAAVAEVVAASDAIKAYCDYTRLALTPSEVRHVTRLSTDGGIISMLLPQFHDMRDIAINDVYGNDYTGYYNLTDKVAKGAYVHQLTAVFPWWKATYEEGGVPGILFQDYQCNGFATETQIKEMKFFKSKLDEMLADPAVKAKTKTDCVQGTEDSMAKYTYKPDFLIEMVESEKSAAGGK